MYKVDLHTHSQASKDGALTHEDYARALESGRLDFIAVTDHHTVDFAKELQGELGEKIIVGEEIKTTDGEIIGLYLQETIPGGLAPQETVARIRAQKGLVCIPHPFETVRSGLSLEALEDIADEVDIIEVHNGRAVFQNQSELAKEWAVQHQVAGVASSDAHGRSGWGRTYTILPDKPSRRNLVRLLHQAAYEARWPGIRGILYPKFNRLRKKLGGA